MDMKIIKGTSNLSVCDTPTRKGHLEEKKIPPHPTTPSNKIREVPIPSTPLSGKTTRQIGLDDSIIVCVLQKNFSSPRASSSSCFLLGDEGWIT